MIFNGPGVAGAVLQTPLSFSHLTELPRPFIQGIDAFEREREREREGLFSDRILRISHCPIYWVWLDEGFTSRLNLNDLWPLKDSTPGCKGTPPWSSGES